MRKYLVTGLAAVAISGMFTSCTHETGSASDSANLGVVETYEQAFLNRFGTPSPEADWGFGPDIQAGTRSGNMTGKTPVAQTSNGINANANEWADKANAPHGHGGWLVPPALTEPQKEVVRKYFQANPKLEYKDPHFANFFVQQVYKGGTNKPETGNKETNKGADGTSYSSDNMNLLTVGYNEQHINNFNRGTYNAETVATDSYGNPLPGTKADDGMVNVLDNGYTVNDFADHHHPDQIMLMVNIDDTECMGYHNSGCSKQRNDKAALVGWETIRDWANQNGLNGNCLDDKWNRSFVGFDFALYNLDESYHKNGNDKVYAQFSNGQNNGLQYVWDGKKVKKRGTSASTRTRSIGTRAGANVSGSHYFRVKAEDNPEDGHIEYLYDSSELIGKITFGGTGEPAITTEDWGGFTAKIYRPYIKFTALATNGNLYLTQDKHENDGCECIVWDETTNTKKTSGVINWANWYIGVEGGHTYKIYYSTGDNLGFYGLYYEVWGQSVADPDGEGGNNNQGSDETQGNQENENQGNQENNNDQTQEEDYEIYEGNYLIVDGKQIPFLKTNMNMYGGILYGGRDEALSDSDMKITKDGKECFNMEKIEELVHDGYLPVWDKNLRTWVKWEFGDGYFSDWIVTLTEAKRNDTPTPEPDPEPFEAVVRVIAEDMGDQNLNENSDFDFNDVVFDVEYIEEGKVKITILAAGGTLPLTLGWDGTGDYITHEVHYRLGYSESTMINTHSKVGYHQDGVKPYEFEYTGTFRKASFKQDVRDYIPVKVRKNGTWYNINADQGRAPGKLCVGTDYTWCNERQDIDSKWKNANGGLFLQYVNNPKLLTSYWYREANR